MEKKKKRKYNKEMKYIISRILLLINSVIITVQLDDNDYNNNVNTLETTEYKEHDIPLLSEYLKSTTMYQEYNKYINWCIGISLAFYIILYSYKFSVLFTIIKKAKYQDKTNNEEKNINILKKIAEFMCHVLWDIVLIVLLIVPIIFSNIILNVFCYFIFIILYSFLFIFGFYIGKVLPIFTSAKFENNLGNIIDKLRNIELKYIKDIKENILEDNYITLIFINISPSIKYIILFIVLLQIIGVILSIIPRIITFWNKKELVVKDINNWISTSPIMKYILRNINNKFNIFSLPIASTNITLSESISSLLLSLSLLLVVCCNHLLSNQEWIENKRLKQEKGEEERKIKQEKEEKEQKQKEKEKVMNQKRQMQEELKKISEEIQDLKSTITNKTKELKKKEKIKNKNDKEAIIGLKNQLKDLVKEIIKKIYYRLKVGNDESYTATYYKKTATGVYTNISIKYGIYHNNYYCLEQWNEGKSLNFPVFKIYGLDKDGNKYNNEEIYSGYGYYIDERMNTRLTLEELQKYIKKQNKEIEKKIKKIKELPEIKELESKIKNKKKELQEKEKIKNKNQTDKDAIKNLKNQLKDLKKDLKKDLEKEIRKKNIIK